MVVLLAEKWHPEALLIEDKASGQSLLQDLRRETALPAIAIKAIQDKITRFAACSALFEAGKVYLPQSAPFLAAYETELLAFPHGAHDDMVDATSQFLGYIRERKKKTIQIRSI
jgi:predicted phage terminase large subunit-like protein